MSSLGLMIPNTEFVFLASKDNHEVSRSDNHAADRLLLR